MSKKVRDCGLVQIWNGKETDVDADLLNRLDVIALSNGWTYEGSIKYLLDSQKIYAMGDWVTKGVRFPRFIER